MAEKVLTEQQQLFVYNLIENGGNVSKAAVDAGLAATYGYQLRDKLAEHIIEAAQQYIAIHSVKAATQLVDSIDKPMPNPVNLQAALAILDRVGVVKKAGLDTGQAVKANVFILPAKDDEKED